MGKGTSKKGKKRSEKKQFFEVVKKDSRQKKANGRQLVTVQAPARAARIVKGQLKEAEAVMKNLSGSSHGNKQHVNAARAAILPLGHTTQFVAGWANTPTTVASPFTASSVDVSVQVAGAYLEGGSYFCAVSRDPLNAIIEYVPNPTGKDWSYTGLMLSTGVLEAVTVHKAQSLDRELTRLQMAVFHDDYVGDPSKLHPNGGVFFPKTVKGDLEWRSIWCEIGNHVVFKFWDGLDSSTAQPTTGRGSAYRWDGSGFVYFTSFDFTGAVTYTFYVQDGGWYAFSLMTDVGVSYANVVLESGTSPTLGTIGHRPIPGIMDRTTLTEIRVNGASVMITPDASELSKGGLCVGAQLGNAYQVEGFILNAAGGKATDTLLTLKGSVQMDFEKGMYGWHKSMTEESYAMQRPFRYNIDYAVQTPDGVAGRETVGSYVSYMTPPDGWVALAVNTPLNVTGGSVSYPGGVMHTTWAWSVEYVSNDVWVGARIPQMGAGHYDQVMGLLSRAPQFMTNEFHVRELVNWLRSNLNLTGREVGRFVRTFGPDMEKALKMVLTGASALAQKAERF